MAADGPCWPEFHRLQMTTDKVMLLGLNKMVANVSSLSVSKAIQKKALIRVGEISGSNSKYDVAPFGAAYLGGLFELFADGNDGGIGDPGAKAQALDDMHDDEKRQRAVQRDDIPKHKQGKQQAAHGEDDRRHGMGQKREGVEKISHFGFGPQQSRRFEKAVASRGPLAEFSMPSSA